jgi:hypothetical protein
MIGTVASSQGERQVDRDRRLADTTLPGPDRNHVLDAGQWRPSLLGRRHRTDLGRQLHVHRRHARQSLDGSHRLIAHLILDRTGGSSELDRKGDATTVDDDILHEVE